MTNDNITNLNLERHRRASKGATDGAQALVDAELAAARAASPGFCVNTMPNSRMMTEMVNYIIREMGENPTQLPVEDQVSMVMSVLLESLLERGLSFDQAESLLIGGVHDLIDDSAS